MGRHPVYPPDGSRSHPPSRRWEQGYRREWAAVVGDRVRRLRKEEELTLHELSALVMKPEGGWYSAGYLSRLERGWASAPLYVYLSVADALNVDPGRLFGLDDVQKQVSDAELTLLRCLRRLEVSPDAALAGLVDLGRGRAE